MGDGILVEFQSVINALRCAVDIQRTEAELNAGAPADERLEFRIAINLGDVIVEGDDIHGNGVNIADRLQALARPGGVVISGTAYDQVTNHLDVGYEFLGEQRVKNIAEPVRVYGVLTGLTSPAPAAASRAGKAATRRWLWPAVAAALVVAIAGGAAWWRPWAPSPAPPAAQVAPAGEQADHSAAAVEQAASTPASPAASAPSEKPSLVVLPFDNLSDDKEQGYLADGITEDLTTELARIPGLFVISRNAAFTYKGKEIPPAKIAKELGVRYLLEGSIRRVGDDIRINAQLIDGESSGHIWAERFDGAWAKVFELQDEMVGQIATALKLRLVESQRAAQIAGGTSNPAAYDAWLRGLELENRGTPEDIAKAATSYQQAVALDPDYGRAWASLAWLYWNIHGPEQEKALGLTWPEIERKTGRSLAGGRKASLADLLSDTGGPPRSAAEIRRGDRGAGKGHRAQFEQRLELRIDELGVDVQRPACRKGAAISTRRRASTRRRTAGAITWWPSHISRWIGSTKPLRH